MQTALADEHVSVRRSAVEALGRAKDVAVAARIEQVLREDTAWRVREAALAALARLKAESAFDAMKQAIATESPDDILRNQALDSLGDLGKDEAAALLLEWSAAGKPDRTRTAALGSLAQLDKKNDEITRTLLAYLEEPRRSVRFQFAVFGALLQREDPSVAEPLQRWLDSGTAGILAGFLQPMLNQFKQRNEQRAAGGGSVGAPAATGGATGKPDAAIQQVLDTLQRLERAVSAMNERVKKIEEKVGKN
jgi:ubiquinone biosynthesis protein UbiJ